MEGGAPSKSANTRNALDGLGEVSVKWGFSLDVQETHLSRCAKVEGLDEVEDSEEEGNCGSEVFADDAEDD
jgi:hypothetical protein